MQSGKLLFLAAILCWVTLNDALVLVTLTGVTVGTAALVLGGLAALKGAAFVGYAAGRQYHGQGHYYQESHHQYKRSAESNTEDSENALLSAVGQLDPSGCILKLLCKLQVKEETARTFEEKILVEMFANGTESLTSYNAAFVYAADIGGKTKDDTMCDKYFSKCPLDDVQLSGLFQQAWGCGFEAQANIVEN